ncbi:recombinase family protein [Sessilibacter corallicola]|uniref:Recombinase family protein n=1 Tax=Sessilibacter corallicola TaxID=2904075 RepID=A0ABQ0A9M5_9GAMM|nr:recombinase family protein [Sessilibacter corallicola]MCE2029933.1 recombinase family protein [Sessilibacter corallicola]
MRLYGYLRASTEEQDAYRAKEELEEFAASLGFPISAWFVENESGANLHRPELFRLIDIAQSGDVMLVEQIDRISRLNFQDWERLKSHIAAKNIRIVSKDLPTSHQFIHTDDAFTDRMVQAINGMMLDMLAAIARKDYEDRRRRQAQGVQRAKAEGKYKGRPINQKLHGDIAGLLRDGKSYAYIRNLLGCSDHTIARVKKGMTS